MSCVRVHRLSVSLDGYASGEGQRLDAPFGHAGGRLLAWFDTTRTFRQIHADTFASRWVPDVGADIMGRNMFGPQRGSWEDLNWKGWWGDNPPYQNPVFVLTHDPRPSIEMEGGTTFHFIDAGPADALTIAREPAGEPP
jgi:dihydrofolate reductase